MFSTQRTAINLTDPNNTKKNEKQQKVNNISEEEDHPKLTSCGLGSWRPQWLQMFASPVFFTINFLLIGVIQGMAQTLLIGSMSTLEKRFAYDSKITGLILIADNFSQLVVSPIIGYFGSRFNRPRMIAAGEIILALSCFTTALPYFIYGAGTHLLHDDNLLSKHLKNETKYELCPSNPNDIDCSNGKYSTIWPAVILLWMGSFLSGLGFTAYFVIGMPYIDDSVSKKSSPIYISLMIAIRLIGPTCGYLLASFVLRFYENPFYDPGITRKDPRFIGAWWIGFVILGLFLFLVSLPMFLFPKQFKGANVKAKKLKDSFKGTKSTVAGLKRFVRNPILMFHMVGGCLRYIGLAGYSISNVKYIESQYRQTSSRASLLTGTTFLGPMSIGIILGGCFITIIKPCPRTLVIYMFIMEIISNGGILIAMFLGCSPMEMPQNSYIGNEYSLKSDCNSNCGCTTSVFTPICSSDKKTTYFSPCFAGCTKLNRDTNTLSGCSCISGYGETATTGYCQSDSDDCNKLFTYSLVLTIGSIISSTTQTGNSLLTLRTVDPKDKSFTMGVMGSFMSIFAFIPYPLIFGAITDSACLVWETRCGQKGNCWIYDQDKFRYYLHGSTFVFIMIGSLFDLGIIYFADRLKNFYDEPNKELEQNNKENNTDEKDMSQLHMNSLSSDQIVTTFQS